MRRKRIGRDGERSVGINVSELNREVNIYMNSNLSSPKPPFDCRLTAFFVHIGSYHIVLPVPAEYV